MKKPSVLFVCLGNICRSPMAEALLKKKLGTDKFLIDSAGLDDYHLGETPCELTMQECRKHNCYPDHRARLFETRDFDRFDWIYVMDKYNLREVLNKARNEADRKKVKLILEEVYPGEQLEVPDPYMQNGEAIELVYQLLDQATDVIARKLLTGEK